jgi:hypothetical protein
MQEVKEKISALLLKAKENDTPIEITSNDLCQLFADHRTRYVKDNVKSIAIDPLFVLNGELHYTWISTFLKVFNASDSTKHLSLDIDNYLDNIAPVVTEQFNRINDLFISEVLKQQEKDKKEVENLKEMLRLFVQGTKITLENLEKK